MAHDQPEDAPKPVPPPVDLRESGRALWEWVTGEFEIDPHERLVLLSAARTADLLDRLAAEINALSALTAEGRKTDVVIAPVVAEHRQQSLTLSRLVAALRIPEDGAAGRPQRRGGARGPYAVPSRRAEDRALRGVGS